jgi:formate-dependent nitrite reductase membrane component NrfD
LFYFFLAGLSGGSYFIASLLRVAGRPTDEPAARLGSYAAFAALVPCPVLLTLDLGQPLRFWHMLVNTTPGELAPAFKYWSPMSVGAWALAAFGLFVTVSFVEALARDRVIRIRLVDWALRPLTGVLGKLWYLIGGLLGLFVAGYTGVLLAVSNQPVWSDTWVLGGLFLASGLSGSAALLGWLVRRRSDAGASAEVFARFERFFPWLELALIVAFVVSLIPPGALHQAFALPWLVFWLIAVASLLPGISGVVTVGATANADGGTAVMRSARGLAWVTVLVLVGVLAMRVAVIFSAQ